MKKIYFLLFISLLAHTTVSAQRQVNLRMLAPRFGFSATNTQPVGPYQRLYHDNKTEYFFAFVFKNMGPDALLNYDTISVNYIDGTVYTGNHFTANPGDTVVFVPNLGSSIFYMPFGAAIGSSDTLQWCDSVRVAAGASNTPLLDPDLSNNVACYFVEAYYDWRLGVGDVHERAGELQVFPNPATTSLTIKHSNNRNTQNARITLQNVLGQQVHAHSLQYIRGEISYTVDISHLPAGLYTAELHYDDQTVIQKFSIQ